MLELFFHWLAEWIRSNSLILLLYPEKKLLQIHIFCGIVLQQGCRSAVAGVSWSSWRVSSQFHSRRLLRADVHLLCSTQQGRPQPPSSLLSGLKQRALTSHKLMRFVYHGTSDVLHFKDVQELSYVWALGEAHLLLARSFSWSSLRTSQWAALLMPSHSLIKLRQWFIWSVLHK